MGTKLYPFQKVGVKKIQRFGGRALLADEMGLGKTIITLWWAKKHLDSGPIVVVCPATLKENWRREAARHINMRAEILESKSTPANGLRGHPADLYIINYDILGDPKDPDSWVNVLKRAKPQLVVLEECHYCKGRDTQRTKSSKHLAEGVPHVIAISGTPMTNRPVELWPVLNIVKPQLFPSFWSYGQRYCSPQRTPWGWKYTGAANLDELHSILKTTCMVRRLKKNVLDQLPTKTRTVLPLEITNRKEYLQALHSFLSWLRKYSKSRAKKAAKAEKLVQMGYLKRLAAKFKMPNVLKWMDDFLEDSGEKMIVFAVHNSVVTTIAERFGKMAVVVDGTVTGRKRQLAIDGFNTDPRIRLLVGNIQAAGVGWSCKSTSNVAFAELPWVPGEVTQAEDRVHGIGRGVGNANYFFLVAKNTIEEKLVKILHQKQDVLDAALDGSMGVSQFDILDKLEEALQQEERKHART